MNHEPWLDQLPWYAAGKLSAEDRAALEHHLESCET
ncbi:MAG: zf-HC2 domain-containing protein, partial [Chloroflexi bacterium]|nr:zf-HC2 domain-containing protein [Chloroflexota bacterium]